MTTLVTTDPAGTDTGLPVDRRRWTTLGVLTAAVVLDGLVSSIGAAGHPIQESLHVPDAAMASVLYGYGLVFLLTLLPAGRLADVVGYRRVFVAGAGLFTLGSLLSGLATNASMLAAARLVEGVGAAAMIPQVLSAIMLEFAPHEQRWRVTGYALYGVVMAFVAPSTGVIWSELIAADVFGLGWRFPFLAAAVAGALLLLAALRVVPSTQPVSPRRFDWGGMVLAVVGLVVLVYPLSVGGGLGWPAWTWFTLALAVPVFALLLWHEIRRARRDASALAAPVLFRDRGFAGGMVVIVVMSFAILGFFPFFAAYLNTGLGFSLGQVWLASVAWPVGILLWSLADIWLAPRLGRGLFIVGMAVMAVSIATLIPVFHAAGPSITPGDIAPALFVAGLGKGFMTPGLIDLVLRRVPRADSGSASGILLTVQQVGGNVGFVVLGAVLAAVLGAQVATANPAVTAAVRAAEVPADAEQAVRTAFQSCLHDRVVAADPTVTPESCRAAQQTADRVTGSTEPGRSIQASVKAAADDSRQDAVAKALERGLWYEVVMLILATALMLLLPPARRRATSSDRIAAG